MDSAPMRSEMLASYSGRFLEVRCIHFEDGAARNAIPTGTISEDRPE